jgi:hypothetical protein
MLNGGRRPAKIPVRSEALRIDLTGKNPISLLLVSAPLLHISRQRESVGIDPHAVATHPNQTRMSIPRRFDSIANRA